MKLTSTSVGLAVRGVVALAFVSALVEAFLFGELYELHHQATLCGATRLQVQTTQDRADLVAAERDYYKAVAALDLSYFDALRDYCLPYRRPAHER